jgi:hypothetical protein
MKAAWPGGEIARGGAENGYDALVARQHQAGAKSFGVAAGALGVVATLLAEIYSLKTLCALIPLERLPRIAQRIIVLFRLAPSNTGV